MLGDCFREIVLYKHQGKTYINSRLPQLFLPNDCPLGGSTFFVCQNSARRKLLITYEESRH